MELRPFAANTVHTIGIQQHSTTTTQLISSILIEMSRVIMTNDISLDLIARSLLIKVQVNRHEIIYSCAERLSHWREHKTGKERKGTKILWMFTVNKSKANWTLVEEKTYSRAAAAVVWCCALREGRSRPKSEMETEIYYKTKHTNMHTQKQQQQQRVKNKVFLSIRFRV